MWPLSGDVEMRIINRLTRTGLLMQSMTLCATAWLSWLPFIRAWTQRFYLLPTIAFDF